jgi:hypothetical protein
MLPDQHRRDRRRQTERRQNAEAVVAFVTEGSRDAGVKVISKEDHRAIARLIAAGVVRGKAKELAFDIATLARGGTGACTPSGSASGEGYGGDHPPGGGAPRAGVAEAPDRQRRDQAAGVR